MSSASLRAYIKAQIIREYIAGRISADTAQRLIARGGLAHD